MGCGGEQGWGAIGPRDPLAAGQGGRQGVPGRNGTPSLAPNRWLKRLAWHRIWALGWLQLAMRDRTRASIWTTDMIVRNSRRIVFGDFKIIFMKLSADHLAV